MRRKFFILATSFCLALTVACNTYDIDKANKLVDEANKSITEANEGINSSSTKLVEMEKAIARIRSENE